MSSGRLFKIVPSGLGNYEVHGRHPYSFDDQAGYNHIATHSTRDSAKAQVKHLTETQAKRTKELMKEKRAEVKGYRNLHDKLGR